METSQRQMEKEGTQEQKKNLIVAVWEREEARGGPRMQKRGDRAPRAQDSPQLSLSVLPGDFDTSDASLSFSLPFCFHNSNRLALLHLRENARGCLRAHTRRGFLDKKPHCTLHAGIGQTKRENMMSGKQNTQIERELESEE